MKALIKLAIGAAVLAVFAVGAVMGFRYWSSPKTELTAAKSAEDKRSAEAKKPAEVKKAVDTKEGGRPGQETGEPEVAEGPPAQAPASAPGKDTDHLLHLYEGMRPKEAAAVMSQLDPDLSVTLLLGMRERQAAKILGQLPPKRAAELVTRMSQAKRAAEPARASAPARTEAKP